MLDTLLLLCALSSPAPAAPAAEDLRLAPAEGLRLEKIFELELREELSGLRIFAGEEELTGQALQDRRLERTLTQRVVVRDDCVRVREGRADELRRAFVELTREQVSKTAGGGAPEEVSRERALSPLAGERILLVRPAPRAPFLASWQDPEPRDAEPRDSSPLAGVEGPEDLVSFLPAAAVEVGDEWQVPVSAWRELLLPGGELGFVWQGADRPAEQAQREELMAGLPNALEGELTARFAGRREVDGMAVGVIALTGVLSATLTDELQTEGLGTQGDELTVTWQLELEGELLWNLARHYPQALSAQGPTRVSERRITRLLDRADRETAIRQELEFSGEARFAVSYGRP